MGDDQVILPRWMHDKSISTMEELCEIVMKQESQISTLTSTVERLTKALEPFAKYGEKLRDPVYSRQGFFTHCFPHEWWIEAADAFAANPPREGG